MPTTMTQPRSGSDVQPSGHADYRIVPVVARRGYVALDAGQARIDGVAAQARVAFSDAWNARMGHLGARQGSWDELRQLLPA